MAARKQYIKPEISSVTLIPDEAVLGGCKTPTQAGAGQSQCTLPTACLTDAT